MIFLIALPYVIWVLYLAIMTLRRSKDAGTLPAFSFRLGLPLLYVGLLLDFLGNVLIASVILLEVPHEWTISARLSRLKYHGSGWRQRVATWIGANMLDPFDPSGQHLKP